MDKLQISHYRLSLKKKIIKLRGIKLINLFFGLSLVSILLYGILSQPVLQDIYHQITLKIIQIFESPLKLAHNIRQNFTSKFVGASESIKLKRLKQQNYILQYKLIEAMNENQRLERISHFASGHSNRFLSVDVIGTNLPTNYQFLFASVGQNQGVRIKQPVFYHGILVGIIDKITLNTCRICLISNIRNRIPAYIHDQSHQGIVYGDDYHTLRFEIQNDKEDIYINDLVYSSGRGGIYPAHKIIGKIAAVENKIIKVKPIIDFTTIDTVQIILASAIKEVQYLQKGINENDDLSP